MNPTRVKVDDLRCSGCHQSVGAVRLFILFYSLSSLIYVNYFTKINYKTSWTRIFQHYKPAAYLCMTWLFCQWCCPRSAGQSSGFKAGASFAGHNFLGEKKMEPQVSKDWKFQVFLPLPVIQSDSISNFKFEKLWFCLLELPPKKWECNEAWQHYHDIKPSWKTRNPQTQWP